MAQVYYQDEWVTLYCGDNRPILAALADQSVDLVRGSCFIWQD